MLAAIDRDHFSGHCQSTQQISHGIADVLRFGSGSEPRTVPKAQHGIGREAISQGSRKVCEVLHAQGHQAYVVGGAVRDLLLGLRPKDFDVATDAYPEEVHKLFRRSRLIGKRFKLVHVMFGEETVEVSTFRARTPAETDEHGRVLRDNIYGTREDDSIRRDFTINALYYDPASETLLDYHNGLRDLQRKSVRSQQRFERGQCLEVKHRGAGQREGPDCPAGSAAR